MGAPWLGPALLVATALGWFALEVRDARHRREEADDTDRRSLLVLRCATAAAFVLAVAVSVAVPQAAFGRPSYVVALPLIWAGVAIRVASKAALGRYFTYAVQTSAGQPVIDTGPYRWVRHPAYLGMALALLGFVTVIGNWLSLLVFLPTMLVGVVYRIRVEERALLDASGPAYADYARHRARLVPHVW